MIYTESIVSNMYNDYLNMKSIKKVALKHSTSYIKLFYALKDFEAKNGFNNIKRNKYECNHSYFSKDTPESFYWAGFIAADGCLYQNKYNKILSIGLQSKDVDHLYKLKEDLGYSGLIRDNKSSCLIQIASKQIFSDLKRFGISNRKSFIYKMPEWLINHDFVNHFIRGYFDGDGSVWIRNNSLRCGFCGTKETMEQVLNIFTKIDAGFKNTKIGINKSIFVIAFCGQKSLFVRDFMYKDCSDLFLERKYNRFFKSNFSLREHREMGVIGTSIVSGEKIYFRSMRAAERAGFFRISIKNVCTGKQKQHKGYFWQFKNGGLNG